VLARPRVAVRDAVAPGRCGRHRPRGRRAGRAVRDPADRSAGAVRAHPRHQDRPAHGAVVRIGQAVLAGDRPDDPVIVVFVSIPVLAAAIGYVTKLVAIRMMVEPLDYVGRRPFGWQGIVPRHAARMAGIAVDMMTTQLISPADVVRRLDPDRIAAQIAGPLRAVAGELAEEIAAEFQPE